MLDIAWDRVFYEIYRHEHEGEAPKASCHVYCIKHEDFSCLNRKELYDFYYTAITLTTGYKYIIMYAGRVTVFRYYGNNHLYYQVVQHFI